MKRLVLIALLPVLFISISMTRIVPVPDVRQISGMLGMKGKALGELDSQTQFRQSFVPRQSSIAGIAINFGNYLRSNRGTVTLTLSTLGRKPRRDKPDLTPEDNLVTLAVPASRIREKDHVFWFERKNISPGAPLLITISSTSPREQAVTVWASRTDRYKEGLLFVNDSPVDGDMVFQTYYFESLADIFAHALKGKRAYVPLVSPYLILGASLLLFSLMGLAISNIASQSFNS